MKTPLCGLAVGVLIAGCSGPQITHRIEKPAPIVLAAADVDPVEGAAQFQQSDGGVLLAVSIRSLDRRLNPEVANTSSMRGRSVYITAPGRLVAVAEIKSQYTFEESSAMALSIEASSKAGRPVYISAGAEVPAIPLWFESQEAAEDFANRLWGSPNPSDPWVALERHLSGRRFWILPQSEGASGSAWRPPPNGVPGPLPKYGGP